MKIICRKVVFQKKKDESSKTNIYETVNVNINTFEMSSWMFLFSSREYLGNKSVLGIILLVITGGYRSGWVIFVFAGLEVVWRR